MKQSLIAYLTELCQELSEAGIILQLNLPVLETGEKLNNDSPQASKIPKIIHYCWFGKGEFSQLTKKCIESWKKYCPDYKLIEWNESNFDIDSNLFVKQAYEAKKYAFVSDYVRAYALSHYGGIYLDTDVELLKPLDGFLGHEAFSCFENPDFIQTALLGVKPGFFLIKELFNYYQDRSFINNGTFDQTTNVYILSNLCDKYGFVRNGHHQSINGFIIYPQDFFCPLCFQSHETKFTDNTHAIHHFNSSWW